MPTTIVVGGQYGSEGKGKVVALIANMLDEPWIIRCGGPNSGHTVTIKGEEIVLRQVPTGVINPGSMLFIAAGCVIKEDILIQELDRLEIPRERIFVDQRAVIIQDYDIHEEDATLKDIGSTCSGTGAALIRRISRTKKVQLVGDSAYLRDRVQIETLAPLVHSHLDKGGHVIVEGTQGFALSILHGPDYPYCTSRDTTAASFAMEVGLSPMQINEIIMVIRTFPIRVGGASGPFKNEISWAEVSMISGAPDVIPEYTSVTKRLRRVARFDLKLVKMASIYNRPIALAIMGLDRLDYKNHRVNDISKLSPTASSFINSVQKKVGVPVKFLGTGFATNEVIILEDNKTHKNKNNGS